MLQSVDIGERSLDAYRGVAPEATIDELRRQAEDLRGARVLHINPTPYGVPHAAAKWGLVGVTQSLRAEYADAPIGFSVVCRGFVAGEGMFGCAAALGVRAPAAFGTTTAPEVAAAVVRSIEHDLPEVIVTPRPARSLLAFAALAPRTAERLAVRLGTTRFARDAARAQGRL